MTFKKQNEKKTHKISILCNTRCALNQFVFQKVVNSNKVCVTTVLPQPLIKLNIFQTYSHSVLNLTNPKLLYENLNISFSQIAFDQHRLTTTCTCSILDNHLLRI